MRRTVMKAAIVMTTLKSQSFQKKSAVVRLA